MSNVSSAHTVIVYESGKTKALSGQRLSKHSWKTDKETGKKRDSLCVSIPVIAESVVTENISVLMPHFQSYLESVQDKMIKEMMEKEPVISHVMDSDISVSAMIEYLESSNESGRITKEVVSKWFEESIEEKLALALSEKLGIGGEPTDAQSAQIMKITEAFKEQVASMAGGKTVFTKPVAENMKKVLSFASEDDPIAQRFNVRLDKMISKPEIDLLNLL